jgi:hypothetical protein
MPQSAPNANIKIVPSTMVTPSNPQAGCAFAQLSPASIFVAQQSIFYQKEPHYHFNFFISSLMKRILANFTPRIKPH